MAIMACVGISDKIRRRNARNAAGLGGGGGGSG
jgi:hypothetical protein